MNAQKSKLTRRGLAGLLAGAAAMPAQQPEAPQAAEETQTARAALRRNREQIAKVEVQRHVEPAFRFQA
jgi:hypothetical protein